MLSESTLRSVELFHLLFTRSLTEKVEPALFTLKGGCNLRFFFKSIRYSEDIDFDVHTIARDTLKAQVSKLLEGVPFQTILASRGIILEDVSAPKQTDTTQRWKMKIRSSNAGSISVPTKIEFSRREKGGANGQRSHESVDNDLIRFHSLYPVLCGHYLREAAILQKVSALAHRTEVQARDVFDLNHLFIDSVKPSVFGGVEKNELEAARENCLSISYSDYRSQVVSYLIPEYQTHFGTEEEWNKIQNKILEVLS